MDFIKKWSGEIQDQGKNPIRVKSPTENKRSLFGPSHPSVKSEEPTPKSALQQLHAQPSLQIQTRPTAPTPRAQAAARAEANPRSSTKNRNPRGTKYTTLNQTGVTTQETFTQNHPTKGIKGVKTHDMAWDRTRNQQRGGTAYQVPKPGSPNAALNRSRMQASVGHAMSQVPIGDHVTGEFFAGDGQQKRRAGFFQDTTNGVFKPNKQGAFDVTRLGPDTWRRGDGKVIKWNPQQALGGVAKWGTKAALGAAGPAGRGISAFMSASQLVEQMTGKGILQHSRDQTSAGIQQQQQLGGPKLQINPAWGTNTPF